MITSCDGAQTNTSGFGLKTTTQPGAGACGHCALAVHARGDEDVLRGQAAVEHAGALTRQVGGGW